MVVKEAVVNVIVELKNVAVVEWIVAFSIRIDLDVEIVVVVVVVVGIRSW